MMAANSRPPRRRIVPAARRFCFAALLLLAGCGNLPTAPAPQPSPTAPPVTSSPDAAPRKTTANNTAASRIPDHVWKTYDYILAHDAAPEGYVGGRKFGNYEGRLPGRDQRGRTIHYREWDVYQKEKGVNRGAERLITGDDGSAFYTSDHYETFTRIDQLRETQPGAAP